MKCWRVNLNAIVLRKVYRLASWAVFNSWIGQMYTSDKSFSLTSGQAAKVKNF